MKFVDSNVFLHAFLVPRRELSKKEKMTKHQAKSIVKAIEAGKEVAMTTAHLSEVVNIIETGLGLEKSLGFLSWAISSENIKILPVTLESYEGALPIAREAGISANDALACLAMEMNQIREIYTFDKHFDRVKGKRRLTTVGGKGKSLHVE